jgi:hypothetical protein
MVLLVSGASAAMRKYRHSPLLGWLLTPTNGNSTTAVLAANCLWAADNDCFAGLDERRFLKMLRRISHATSLERFKFVSVPDVVGDARATLASFEVWAPRVREFGLPLAYVAQDGQEALPVPWSEFEALFVGGTTTWKMGPHAARLIVEAQRHGKWVHVGRVNTSIRARYMGSLDVDSIDGSCFSRWPDKHLPRMLRTMSAKQHGMLGLMGE